MTTTGQTSALRAFIVPVTAFRQNATLLWSANTMHGAIVDPGGDLDTLLEVAQSQGVTIDKLLVTHGHIDHCGMAGVLAKRLGVPVEGPHIADKFWIDQAPVLAQNYGMAGADAFTPDRWLADGDRVQVSDLVFDVIHCPGHTPGHVVFYYRPSRFALVGDVLFQGSIGRTDFPKGNFEQLVQSITGKLWPLGNDTRFVPGHGPMSTFGDERQSNPFVGDAVL